MREPIYGTSDVEANTGQVAVHRVGDDQIEFTVQTKVEHGGEAGHFILSDAQAKELADAILKEQRGDKRDTKPVPGAKPPTPQPAPSSGPAAMRDSKHT